MKRVIGVLMAILLAGSACSSGGNTMTSPTTTATTTTPATTETFTGTVPVGGLDIHTFTAAAGVLTVTLTSAEPPPTIFMGLGLGVPSDTTCTFFTGASTAAQASSTAQLQGTLTASGSVCVEVYDIGNEASPVNYSVTVAHN